METTAWQGLGLTRTEAQIYLALAQMGSASASELIQKTGLHRAVVYNLLERLIEKGLAGFVHKGKKRYFEAASPARLLELQKEQGQKVKEIVEKLAKFSQFTSTLEVKLYKGKEGLFTVFEDILRSGVKEWLVVGSSGSTIKLLPYYLEHFQKKRAKLGIRTKALMINNESGKKRGKELQQLQNTEVRFLPVNITTPTVIQIYGNKIIIHSNKSDPPFVIVIENKDIADSFREYFSTFWSVSKQQHL
jgi:sugar-specific transcriptional regulator TrmB